MKYKTALFLIFLIAIPGVSLAEERLVKFDLGLGLTFGGDELAYATFTSGDTQKIKAGELLHFYGGLLFDIPDSPISTRVAIGYHFDDITAKNGKIEFTRMPLEIIPFYNLDDRNRIGAGLTYHLNPEFTSDVLPDISFDDALGFLVEYGHGFSEGRFWLGLRYVNIDYKPVTIDGYPLIGAGNTDGSHFGIYMHTAL